jgi:hypothetical protein
MTVAHWWEQVVKPVRNGKWSQNTRIAYDYTWRKHIEPHVGSVRLSDMNKLTIDRLLLKLADASKGACPSLRHPLPLAWKRTCGICPK